jgi:NADP-dependent 3-hydroxy acid dehydrogenase YdfG
MGMMWINCGSLVNITRAVLPAAVQRSCGGARARGSSIAGHDRTAPHLYASSLSR